MKEEIKIKAKNLYGIYMHHPLNYLPTKKEILKAKKFYEKAKKEYDVENAKEVVIEIYGKEFELKFKDLLK